MKVFYLIFFINIVYCNIYGDSIFKTSLKA